MNPPKLINQVRSVLRVKHRSLRTEEACWHWIKRFILFHQKRHPNGQVRMLSEPRLVPLQNFFCRDVKQFLCAACGAEAVELGGLPKRRLANWSGTKAALAHRVVCFVEERPSLTRECLKRDADRDSDSIAVAHPVGHRERKVQPVSAGSLSSYIPGSSSFPANEAISLLALMRGRRSTLHCP